MSIARMKKIHITGHNSIREDAVGLLHQWGAVQVNDLREEFKDKNYFENNGEKKKTGEDNLRKVTFITKFLERFGMKTSMLKVMSEGKEVVSRSRLEEVMNRLDMDGLYGKCRELEKLLRQTDKNRVKAHERISQLKPWVAMRVKLAELQDTVKTRVKTGTVDLKDYDELITELRNNPGTEVIQVGRDNKSGYIFLVYLKTVDGVVDELLKKHEFNQVSLPLEDLEPEGFINQLENSIRKYDKQEEELVKKAEGLTSNKQYLNILYDYYVNFSERESVGDFMAGTSSSFFLSGWIEGKNSNKVKKELESKFREIEVFLADPQKGEQVPIVFENNRLVKPLEFVTDLYGKPEYSGIDPTPYFALFFLLFFALCITDAGYGILLTLASLFVLKKYKMGPGGTRFWKLGLYGGITTIVVGALMGGWFGNTIDILPGFQGLKDIKGAIMIMDPIKSSQTFLYFSFLLGLIQVMFGIAVKFYMDIRDGDIAGAFLDELPWFICLPCFVPIIIGFFGGGPVSGAWGAVVKVCLLVVLLFNGRKSKNIILRLVKGTYRIYGGIDYMKDILSYSRLFALGLGTGIMAMAVNNMVTLIPSGSIVGVVFMVLIFVGGHTFNFVMNLLSAYIHTSRLQYVEFFTKFYESGGQEFRPFMERRKFTEAS